jgi:hypothetical protein
MNDKTIRISRVGNDMGWMDILKLEPITNNDIKNFAQLKSALKKEMGYEKFSQVEAEGLLDLEQWILGNWPSPEEVTSGKTVGESLVPKTWVKFTNSVSKIYDQDIPIDIQEIILDMSEIADKLADIASYV